MSSATTRTECLNLASHRASGLISLFAVSLVLGACARKEIPAESPSGGSDGHAESAAAEEAAAPPAGMGVASPDSVMFSYPGKPPAAMAPPPPAPAPARIELRASDATPTASSKATSAASDDATVDVAESAEEAEAPVAAKRRRRPPTLAVARPELTAGIFDDNQSFDFFQRYREQIISQQLPGLPEFGNLPAVAHASYAGAQHQRGRLDISLVIDTTGSMGDELAYLQNEFDSISGAIAKTYPNSEQRWSLIVYRDEGDDYVVRSHPFTDRLDTFQTDLSRQTFGGGGDYPEAPDQALATATQLRWRGQRDVARLLFWVADAPHHIDRATALRDAVAAAQRSDIHIYPVASSGVNELTEFTMRSAAQITHGRYVFLTDDSGVGNSHKAPTLPCYYVTTLSDAILRAVGTEMTGRVELPAPDRVVRQVGRIDAQGRCGGNHGAWAF